MIRTGRAKRLDDFLPFEAACAELHLGDCVPDFRGEDLPRAMRDFRSRQRRFGTIGTSIREVERAPCTT